VRSPQQLADGPPLLFPAIKQLLRHTEIVAEHPAFELHDSLSAVQKVIRSEDLKEGARASARTQAGVEGQVSPEKCARLSRPTPQQRARNDVPLHLARAVPDALDARIAPDALQRQLGHEPHAAMNLQRLAATIASISVASASRSPCPCRSRDSDPASRQLPV